MSQISEIYQQINCDKTKNTQKTKKLMGIGCFNNKPIFSKAPIPEALIKVIVNLWPNFKP